MANNWLTLGEDHPSRNELLKLYELFQDRQIADLDMLHKYANYYVAALLAMLAALAVASPRGYNTSFAGTLIALPMVSIMLAQQGKLMAYRFYRRYNEGRVRLSKIEYILGLQGCISCKEIPQSDLWPKDDGFLLARYRRETQKEDFSPAFVHRRSKIRFLGGYGAGYIIQMTFSVFAALFAVILVGLPVCLLFTKTSPRCKMANIGLTLVGVAIISVYMFWYWHTRKHMERETLDDTWSS